MSDIALVTTTIGTGDILRAYRADDPNVRMIVAGDLRTPHDEVRALCGELRNALYLSPDDQDALGYATGPFVGWRSIQRRNLAILEAMREGADVIYTMDDDIGPEEVGDFWRGVERAVGDVAGFPVTSTWFDPGQYADDRYTARGFPWQKRHDDDETLVTWQPLTHPVGVFHCLHLGDPDTDAVDNMVNAPVVFSYDPWLMKGGILINPATTFAPLNSGATAYRRELAPLLFVVPGVGRYDDIWAGYIAQRVMGAQGWWLGYGVPFTRHTRNPHNLMTDLKGEMFGMEHTLAFCERLREIDVTPTGNALEGLQDVAEGLRGDSRWQAVVDFLDVWVEDVAKVWTA